VKKANHYGYTRWSAGAFRNPAADRLGSRSRCRGITYRWWVGTSGASSRRTFRRMRNGCGVLECSHF